MARITKEELQADVMSIHLVLSKRTRGLVGANDLAPMKPTSWLINTWRGPIVDGRSHPGPDVTADRGAALDVYDAEPLPADHPFPTLDNVLATPHIGSVAGDLYRTFDTGAAAGISK
jgi:phosphoglycerate dehydrogenase-like enzyme